MRAAPARTVHDLCMLLKLEARFGKLRQQEMHESVTREWWREEGLCPAGLGEWGVSSDSVRAARVHLRVAHARHARNVFAAHVLESR